MDAKIFKTLFNNLCCSQCRNDFVLEDLTVINSDKDMLLCRLKCSKCGKDFGDVVLNYNSSVNNHSPLEVIEGPPPISTDDVINAHEYIKKNL